MTPKEIFKSLQETRAYEKSEMTPLRWKLNYVVIPCMLVFFIACVTAGAVLLERDAHKFLAAGLSLFSLGIVPLFFLLLALPLIRKKETEYELKRYAWLAADAPLIEEEEYVFEIPGEDSLARGSVMPSESAESGGAPIKSDVADGKGEDLFGSREYVALTREKIVRRGRTYFSVAEGRCDWAYTRREYSYGETKISLFTSNALLRVRLSVLFEFPDGSYFSSALTKKMFSALRRFSPGMENEREWNYLLSHTKDAFRQILKYGEIRRAE